MEDREKKFKEKLKQNGQSIKWFYDNKVKLVSNLTYGGFTLQLNGYATLNSDIEKQIDLYIGE